MKLELRRLPPVALVDCPPGFFVWHSYLCFKSEYRTKSGRIEAYCDTGEFFWGGTTRHSDREAIVVTPVEMLTRDLE